MFSKKIILKKLKNYKWLKVSIFRGHNLFYFFIKIIFAIIDISLSKKKIYFALHFKIFSETLNSQMLCDIEAI